MQQRSVGEAHAQAIDQAFEMREAAHAAVTLRRFLIVEESEGVGAARAGPDAEAIGGSAGDQMRRSAPWLCV